MICIWYFWMDFKKKKKEKLFDNLVNARNGLLRLIVCYYFHFIALSELLLNQ